MSNKKNKTNKLNKGSKTISKTINTTSVVASSSTPEVKSTVSKYVVNKIKSTDFNKIAATTGFSYSYVGQVLRGTRKNADIITAAKRLAAKRK